MLPSNVNTGRVQGRFIVGVQDGPDPDDEPDFIAAVGTIEFQASVPYLPNPTAVPAPVTILKTMIRGVLDAEGYLCTMLADGSPGVRGLRLVATDDPDLLVQNWTWTVTYRFTAVNGAQPQIATHSIALPSDTTVDLTTVVKVPASPGVGLPQAEAAVLRAEDAATASAQSSAVAEAAALDVVTRANAGEFKGDPGLPGNATMRVDTSVGTRVFITDGVTEKLVSGDTGVRNIASLVSAGWTPNAVTVTRIGRLVQLNLNINAPASPTNEIFLMLPQGFRPLANLIYHRQGVAEIYVGTTGEVRFNSSPGHLRTFTAFTSQDAWPTSLPGTPA